ncbi:hypothetical protein RCL_jg2303.t1 [Rhizophagus clarus]|uniref:Uncharacterized protein n=1 Tax=Rhizophagus clarus TaxID=94130 RepID=A0A8H3KP62_9GLOM|nr:hypothetical protein RCL_jg2303.t1 [Rhizophagus clarus]
MSQNSFLIQNTNFPGHRLKDAIRLGHEECLFVGALSFLRLQLKLLPVAKIDCRLIRRLIIITQPHDKYPIKTHNLLYVKIQRHYFL